jgi:hypothetical protein
VNQDEHTQELLAHYSPIPPTQGKYMKSVDIELMLSVEEERLRERVELVGQCSILVGIVGIISWLIAVSG